MKKTVASWAAACALGCPCVVLAQDKDTYRAEAGIEYFRSSGDSSKSSGIGLMGTYYFNALPTQPQDYPLAAGAFVERTGSVSATYFRTSADVDNFQTLSHGSSYGAQVVFRRPDLPLYVDASYQQSDSAKLRSSKGTEFESDGKSYQLAVGGYVAKRTLLTLELARDTDRSTSTSGSASFRVKSVADSVGIGALHLAQLPGGTYLALSARVAQVKQEVDGAPSEKNHNLSLAATYYPTKRLGLSLGYAYDRGDDRFSEGDAWQAGVSWFVTPVVRLFVDVQRFQARAPNGDFDSFIVGTLVRF